MKKAQLKRSRSAGPFHMDAPLSNLGLDREVIAPASSRTDLAHPSIIRKVGRRSFIISIAITPCRTSHESLAPSDVPAANTELGFGIAGSAAFPPVPRFRNVDMMEPEDGDLGQGRRRRARPRISRIKCPRASCEREAG